MHGCAKNQLTQSTHAQVLCKVPEPPCSHSHAATALDGGWGLQLPGASILNPRLLRCSDGRANVFQLPQIHLILLYSGLAGPTAQHVGLGALWRTGTGYMLSTPCSVRNTALCYAVEDNNKALRPQVRGRSSPCGRLEGMAESRPHANRTWPRDPLA